MCSILCWILSVWEALGFILAWFMHYQQGGGEYPILASRGSFVSRGRKVSLGDCIWSGGACIHAFGSSFSPDFSCARLPMVSSPLASPWWVDKFWIILSRLCWAVALDLGDRDFLSQVIFFGFCLAFDHLLEFLIHFIYFSFFLWIGYYVCCQCTHQGGGVGFRTGASEDWWMVAPQCGEWLTTWCGLTLGRVLQV
jgi:hypothetical protein